AMDLLLDHVSRISEKFKAERDAALAEVERLRESKGDPVGSLEKCMKVMYERDEHAKRLEVALARVAELELGIARIAGDFLPDNSGQAELALDEMRQTLHELLAAIPTQAQHSVPEEFIGRLSEFLAQRGATGKALLRELRDMLAAAPGKEGV
ncbi:hypothetical protein, partial [Pseudomonas aeruginosa]|uniref:hypothetical protein n=1 Tax=Pseudomonas aeruginosa TaxID=287 RepID=UPI001E5702BE